MKNQNRNKHTFLDARNHKSRGVCNDSTSIAYQESSTLLENQDRVDMAFDILFGEVRRRIEFRRFISRFSVLTTICISGITNPSPFWIHMDKKIYG